MHLNQREEYCSKDHLKGEKNCIDEVYGKLRRSLGLSSFRFIKYETLDNANITKIEEAMVDMITNHKLASSEIKNKITKDLYDRLERRWQ